jgi:hypothetical protein
MIARLICFVFLSLTAALSGAEQPDLPAPPDGFQWKWCDKVGVGLPQPTGWFFKSQSENGTDAFFVTKEDIETEGEFQTGLSLNVISRASRSGIPTASEYALRLASRGIEDKASVLDVIPLSDIGHAKTVSYRIKARGSVIHHFLIADDGDRVFIFIYESPQSEWDEAWKIGEQMLTNLPIDFPES